MSIPASKVLIVVNTQNDYFPGGSWTLSGVEEMARKAAQLIAVFSDRGEVVHIRHEFPADTAERYGWINRAIPDKELDAFVKHFAQRVASFDIRTLEFA
ncbi:cysteine hydrolase family protein [Pseudomonas chlororaphis]|uniref:cysteine hydrolase family protein n=1 Tax=Pseudomonas chlororaphis TaxID=587753 RepID=UPI00236561B4|nr:isochorismatase family protein [Pseudomonas chlororaphis]WDH19958.1 isochorismatase family protein [Pseudomonas chlororaphis]